MVEGKKKSRTFRRVYVKTPGGKTVLHYRRRKPAKAQCGNCGALLKGVPQARVYKMRNMPKTMKRPERPYGGVLCTRCMRAKIIQKARISS